MGIWITKARQPTDVVAGWIKLGAIGTWWTGRRPRTLQPNDMMILWKGTPRAFVIGVGRCLHVNSKANRQGNYTFRLRYESNAFPPILTIENLRKDRVLHDAAFLKAGPTGTLHRLSDRHAARLQHLLTTKGLFAKAWEDDMPDVDVPLGTANVTLSRIREHLRKERSTAQAKALIKSAKRAGKWKCAACSLSFKDIPFGAACCEIHHTVPIRQLEKGDELDPKDLVILCSNCHRRVHAKCPPMRVSALKKKLTVASKNGGRAIVT